MAVNLEINSPENLDQAYLEPRGPVEKSPEDWRDQIFYFLLPDRFSDGREDARPLFDRARPGLHRAADKKNWMDAGKCFVGGNLMGIRSKLGYLQGLGITALWIGPCFKQRDDLETYHGYGIQNFLEIDPRFGTRQDLRDLVDDAHSRGIYVILDVVINHTGDNWFYDDNGNPRSSMPYRTGSQYPVHGWRTSSSSSTWTIQSRKDGVWPDNFQNCDWYTRAGRIERWDPESWEDPMNPECPWRRGDFFDLKDLQLDENAEISDEVLNALARVYRYWIALSDCDGMRIDTVKHVSFEAARNFCGAIREYAESIGKSNFLLLGEVTGGPKMASRYLDIFGRNLDATLDLGEPMSILTGFSKGFMDSQDFFSLYGRHDELGSHREVGRYHVSMFDDHDMVGRDPKKRFCAGNASASCFQQVAHAVGVQLTTLGIPCIYYGTEQAFDGSESYHDFSVEARDAYGKIPFEDRYVREAMFGGAFGAFGTAECHFFDTSHPAYLRIAAIARVVRSSGNIGAAMRKGRQYPREVRFWNDYVMPGKGELAAWSRIFFDTEVIVVLNTNGYSGRGAEITVDAKLHPPGSTVRVLYDGAWNDDQLRNPPADQKMTVRADQGRSVVRIDLPAAGMIIMC